jgi:uncharacterized damage-inducible protein DinB
MTFETLQVLVDYHYWARDRMFAAIEGLPASELKRPLGNSFSSVFDTVAHLCSADWVWRSRWEGVFPTALPPSESHADLAGVWTAWQEEERRIRGILARLGPDGVANPIEYQGPDGRRQAAGPEPGARRLERPLTPTPATPTLARLQRNDLRFGRPGA